MTSVESHLAAEPARAQLACFTPPVSTRAQVSPGTWVRYGAHPCHADPFPLRSFGPKDSSARRPSGLRIPGPSALSGRNVPPPMIGERRLPVRSEDSCYVAGPRPSQPALLRRSRHFAEQSLNGLFHIYRKTKSPRNSPEPGGLAFGARLKAGLRGGTRTLCLTLGTRRRFEVMGVSPGAWERLR